MTYCDEEYPGSSSSMIRCRRQHGHPLPHQCGGYVWWDAMISRGVLGRVSADDELALLDLALEHALSVRAIFTAIENNSVAWSARDRTLRKLQKQVDERRKQLLLDRHVEELKA
jgi:hypothetical protein